MSPTHPLRIDELPAIRADLENRGVMQAGDVIKEPYCKGTVLLSQTPNRERFYIFLTDGFITNEAEILSVIKTHPSNPTIFTFGCGNSINRYLKSSENSTV